MFAVISCYWVRSCVNAHNCDGLFQSQVLASHSNCLGTLKSDVLFQIQWWLWEKLLYPGTLFLVYSNLESILFQIKVFYPQLKHSPPPLRPNPLHCIPPSGVDHLPPPWKLKRKPCVIVFITVVFVMYTLPQYACYSSTWAYTCRGNSCTCSHFPVCCCSGRLSR